MTLALPTGSELSFDTEIDTQPTHWVRALCAMLLREDGSGLSLVFGFAAGPDTPVRPWPVWLRMDAPHGKGWHFAWCGVLLGFMRHPTRIEEWKAKAVSP